MNRSFLLALLVLSAGCNGCPGSSAPPSRGGALRVPHRSGTIKIDGELDEVDWGGALRSGAFTDTRGAPARPYSEARLLWDESDLYLALYAADDDIRSTSAAHDGPVWLGDAFSLKLSPEAERAPTFLVDVSSSGVITDVRVDASGARDASWESGIRVSVDRDGSLDDAGDDDEEWVVEAALPLRSLGLLGAPGARLGVEVSRCDTPRGTTLRRCGAWGRRSIELAGR